MNMDGMFVVGTKVASVKQPELSGTVAGYGVLHAWDADQTVYLVSLDRRVTASDTDKFISVGVVALSRADVVSVRG